LDRVRREHANPLTSANRDLQRFVAASPPDRPRVLFVDISTYNASAALLVNRSDLRGATVVAVYREPPTNRRVLDAFPGYDAFLVRWDRSARSFVTRPYRPEDDTEGPPDAFPYNLSRRSYPLGSR
jgi:hypothetical protein